MRHSDRPNICTAHPSIFTALEIERFEAEILGNPRANEHDASAFFANNPKFLLIGEGKEVRREAVLFGPDNNPIGRVDFFRKSYGNSTWDLIELKQPHVEFFSGVGTTHPHLSASVLKAVSQIQDYRQWIRQSDTVRLELERKGIKVFCPGMLVIAGRENRDVPAEVAAELVDRVRHQGVHLYTYDRLLAFAKDHYEANRVIILPIQVFSGSVRWASFEKDLEGRYTYVSDDFARLLNVTPDQVIGKTAWDLFPAWVAKQDLEADRAVGRRWWNRVEAVTGLGQMGVLPNGRRIIVEVTKSPIRNKRGKITGIRGGVRVIGSLPE